VELARVKATLVGEDVDLCAHGDVGSGRVLPSKKIKQDKPDRNIKILMVSVRLYRFALHQMGQFLPS